MDILDKPKQFVPKFPYKDAADEIESLRQQLASLTKGVKIQIPSNTLEQEFSSWHRRGYNKAKDEMHQEVERLKAEIIQEAMAKKW